MKKLLLLCMLITLAQGVQAQTSKGSVVATGSIGYSFEKDIGLRANSEGTIRSYHISPQAGYLISDRMEVGVLASIQKETRNSEHYNSNPEVEQHFEDETTQKAIGVYLKKYIFFTDKLAFTGRGEISYSIAETMHYQSLQHGTGQATFYNSLSENAAFVAAIRPGISFFLSEKISLNTTFGKLRYQKDTGNHEVREQDDKGNLSLRSNEQKSSNFHLNLSSASFSLGLSYFFHSRAR